MGESTLTNCIVYYNSAPTNENYSGSTLSYSCTTPDPEVGVGNITNAPLFIAKDAGNYRLQVGSPCINAGTNQDWMTGAMDLDGHSRIVDNVVDVGAYEYDGWRYDSDSDGMKDAWEQQYGLNPIDGADASLDSDDDGLGNYSEYIADTDPTNQASCFRIEIVSNQSPVTVSFSSSTNRVYSLGARDEIVTSNPGSIVGGQSNIWGTGGTMFMNDDNSGITTRYYRVKVKMP